MGRECIDQHAMRVKRTRKEEKKNPFKLGDPHPEFEAVFKCYHTYSGDQQWTTQEWLDNKRKRDRKAVSKRRKDDPEWAKSEYAKGNQAKRDKMGEEGYLEYMREQNRKNYQKNPEYFAMKASRYQKRIREIYEGLPDNVKREIDEIYELRIQLNEAAAGAGMYGKGANNTKRYSFVVDHILPLNPAPINFNGTIQRPYSGLHAPQNLQILEASENLSKSNTTPEQQ